MMSWEIRPEISLDYPEVYQTNVDAFGRNAEARLVDRLRTAARPVISLVALTDNIVAGHIMFSSVSIETPGHAELTMGLGPVSVRPEFQGEGIGRDLVATGLDRCRGIQASAVVVLGDPGYYSHFGFMSARNFRLDCEYDFPDEFFMALELADSALGSTSGLVRYHTAFGQV